MAKAIIGGLLSGLGKGMVEQSEQRRQQAEQMRREALEAVRRQEDRDFTLRRDQEGREFTLQRDQEGREFTLQRDQEGRDFQLMRDDREHGRQVGLVQLRHNLSSRGGSGGSGGEGDEEPPGFSMSAEEKRIYDEVKGQYTDPMTNKVDWSGFTRHLRDMPGERGGKRWNEIADYLTGDVGASATPGDARKRAEEEAQERGRGLFTSDAKAFAETGGDRDAWIEQRAQEIRGGGASRSGQSTQTAQSGQDDSGQFSSPESVKEAYDRGDITREQALRILRSQFGFQ